MGNDNNLKSKALSGIIWKFSERIIAQFISFIVSIVLARMLMPKEYGIIAIVTIFINIANVFVVSGLGTSLIQKKKSDETDFSTMFWASFFLSVFLYFIIFLLSPYIAKIYNNNSLIWVLRIMALKLPIASLNSIQNAYVAKKMIFKKFFYATLIGTIISAFVGIFLAFNGAGVWALVAQYLINSLIDTIVLYFTIDWKPKFIFSFIRFKRLFNYGWKVMITSLIGTVFEQLRGLIIGVKYDSKDLAYNNKGEQIPVLISVNINSTLESVLFPTLANYQDDKNKMKNVVRKMMKMSSFVLSPVLLGLFAISDSLIIVLLTDKWVESIPFMKIVCFTQLFYMLNTVNLQAIKATGRSDISLKLEFIKKPLCLLVIIFTMNYGPLAICLGNSIYTFFALFINSFPNKKLLNYSLKEQIFDIIPNIISSGIMCILVLILGKILIVNIYLKLLIQIVLGFIIYTFICIITNNKNFYYCVSLIKKVKEGGLNVKKNY